MADIKTIFRELSVILGYILARNKLIWNYNDVQTFISIIKKYCKNIDECNSELNKIAALDDIESFSNIIENGIKLGKLIYEKLKIEGDIEWVGSKVKQKYPFDVKIGSIGISLKEDSYILKNPSFADYLNALLQPPKKYKNVHVFREFALEEFNKWFEYTYRKLQELYYSVSSEAIYMNPKHGAYIKKGTKGLIFGNKSKQIEIAITDPMDNILLNSKIGGDLFEHTISKWIKENLENKDSKYEQLKKECSLKAGENLKNFIYNNLSLDSKKILELFQIYDESYYYGKGYGEPTLYKVPGNNEVDIKLVDIEIIVPKSQLNVYFTFNISNKNGENNLQFRAECRYSHGQFKGIPEAKLYYTDNINHLNNLYSSIN